MPVGEAERLRKRVFKRSNSKSVIEEGKAHEEARELQKIVDETIGYLCQIADVEAELINRLPATRIAEVSDVTNAIVVSETYSDILKIAELDAKIVRCACKVTEETTHNNASIAPDTDKDIQASLKRLDEAVANMCKTAGLDEQHTKHEQESNKSHGAGDKDILSEEIVELTSRNACTGVRGQKKKGRLVGRVSGMDEELVPRSGEEATEVTKQEVRHAPVTIKDIQASLKRLEEAVANMCEIAELHDQPKYYEPKSDTSLVNTSKATPIKVLDDLPEANKQETHINDETVPKVEIPMKSLDVLTKRQKQESHTSTTNTLDDTLTEDIVDLIAELTVQDVLANIQNDEDRLELICCSEDVHVGVCMGLGTEQETATGWTGTLSRCLAKGMGTIETERL